MTVRLTDKETGKVTESDKQSNRQDDRVVAGVNDSDRQGKMQTGK